MKSKEVRKAEALERQSIYSKFTTTQKILKLDLLFGGGLGAKRERAKLAARLVKESEGRVAKVEKPEEPKKPYSKPKRS